MFIHLTLVPYIGHAGELKTKPTQHSVNELRRIGIQPDMLVCRSEGALPSDVRRKIALFASLPVDAIISAQDVDLIYKVPLQFRAEGVDDFVLEHFGMEAPAPQLAGWERLIRRAGEVTEAPLRIALVGKYVKLDDAYLSVTESLRHAGFEHGCAIEVDRVDSETVDEDGVRARLHAADGILIPGGFGMRGVEGKIEAIRFARTRGIPFFGICLGMQCATVEFARDELGLEGANSTEFDTATPHPVIHLMDDQRSVRERGGTMRLGAWPCNLAPESLARLAYGEDQIEERHRHRYEFTNAYRAAFEQRGLVATGTCPRGNLVEIIEVPDHPWFLAVQFHPEFKSKPTRSHPLFRDFIAAALQRHEGVRAELEVR